MMFIKDELFLNYFSSMFTYKRLIQCQQKLHASWKMENTTPLGSRHWVKHLPSSLWPGNIKKICPVKWCSAEFVSGTGYTSCLAHSADLNIFISNTSHLGRLTQGGDAGSGAWSLEDCVDLVSSSSQLIRLGQQEPQQVHVEEEEVKGSAPWE